MMRLFGRYSTVVAGLAAILLMPLAHAQEARTLRVKVPFKFTAGDTACPAGEYFFKASSQRGLIEMTNTGGKLHVYLPLITSIARSSDSDDHLLAFDKVGEGRILSEIWLPGADGALVYAAKGEHQHELVRLVRGQPR